MVKQQIIKKKKKKLNDAGGFVNPRDEVPNNLLKPSFDTCFLTKI